MNYTIEEVLEHTPSWINAMLIAISKIEMEQSLTTAAMLGMKQDDINAIRKRFENQINSPQDVSPSLKEDIRLIEATGGTITKIPRKKNG